jgi:MYXO-CTERM domain-containing protein
VDEGCADLPSAVKGGEGDCGCQTAPGPVALVWALGLLALVSRRRR